MEPKNELDKIFKEGLEHAQFEAPPGAWESISSAVSSSSTQVFWTATAKWIAGAGISAAVVGVAVGVWITNSKGIKVEPRNPKEISISPNGMNNSSASEGVDTSNEAETVAQEQVQIENGTQAQGQQDQKAEVAQENAQQNPQHHNEVRDIAAKAPVAKPQPVPTHITAGQKSGFDCTGSLKLRTEKISNTAWSFQAISAAGAIEWYFGDGAMDYGLLSSHEYSDKPAKYTVVAYSIAANGCRDSAKLLVRVQGLKPTLANIFTPDGDGFNDGYFVEVPYAELYDLKIYDKMNRLVFQTNDPSQPWDGTCSEVPCPEGKYRVTFNYKYPGDEKVSVATQILSLSR
ncbi:MAG: gliding motility-associated C-terminal domain-containing protein [Bacteroidia bacterium]|jgi:gliding motility-associated-like protein